MIPYVQISRWDKRDGKAIPFAIVEPSECWFEVSYNDLGEFEIYAKATKSNLDALVENNLVSIPTLMPSADWNFVWIIKSVQYEFNSSGVRMVSAKGYEAKWLLSTRIIDKPFLMSDTLERSIDSLVNSCMGSTAGGLREIVGFNVAFDIGESETPISETQAPRQNLWEFVSAQLKEHKLGAFVIESKGMLHFEPINGKDKSGSIVFSQSMDNLVNATFYQSGESKKTYCMAVSTYTQNDVESESVVEDSDLATGIDRSEILLASNVSTKYVDENGVEKETAFGSDLYREFQKREARAELAKNVRQTAFDGEIDLANSIYEFGKDYFLGDVVAIRDEFFGIDGNARIVKYTFKQDAKGYGETADYESES
jgi:hypothetical protein